MSIKQLQDYIFVSKNAQYLPEKKRRETWTEAVTRVKEMHLVKYKDYPEVHEDIEWAFEQIRQKRVLGSQRALQFGGAPILKKEARLYNCFSIDTDFITSNGVMKFSDFNDGDSICVLTDNGNWKKAIVKNYGKQSLNTITIKRGNFYTQVRATNNHTWILKDGERTNSLEVGNQLKFAPNIFNEFIYEDAAPEERLYWAYGYIYGDGTRLKDQNGVYRHSMVRLCGEDTKYLSRFEELGFSSSSSLSLKGDVIVSTGKYLKTLPDPSIDSPSLIRAFVAGFLSADGTKDRNFNRSSNNQYKCIQQSGENGINFIKKYFPVAGVYVVSETDKSGEETNFGIRDKTSLIRVINSFGKTAQSFTVEKIEKNTSIEEVWCLEVEDDHSFVLPFGLSTGNCTASYCDRPRFFQETLWLLLCGCGVGFSVQLHHVAQLPKFVERKGKTRKFVIPDSIEGWSDALGVLIASYIHHEEFEYYEGYDVEFDFSKIRPKGAPLSYSTGKAPGPDGLRETLNNIKKIMNFAFNTSERLRPIDCYDIVMHASEAVLSGGIRRSATISLFSYDDKEMMAAKTGNWFAENPQRARSNNSVVLLKDEVTKEQFDEVIKSTKEFGEPGFALLSSTEEVFNPCFEISMMAIDKETGKTGFQGCNLTEINGDKIKSEEDFKDAVRAATIIGTIQAGYTNFPYLGETTEKIFRKEALLGVSITGMMHNESIVFDPEIQKNMAKYAKKVNKEIAKKININQAARVTCVKPSGTTSCILGTSSGIHPHHAKRYIRRAQANKLEKPLEFFKSINPIAVEESVWSAGKTDEVISFCVEVPPGIKTKNCIGAIDLLKLVLLTQQNWVKYGKNEDLCTDKGLCHNVSNTITVKEDEWDDVADFIYKNREHFSGISLLSASGDKDYPQAPFTTVHTPKEIVDEYGDASIFASGVIETALEAFAGNLWKACDCILGFHDADDETKKKWVEKAKGFAEKYFDKDVRKMTYCLKDCYNWYTWVNLKKAYKDVDYSLMVEEEDNTNFEGESACVGGKCLI